MFRLKFLYIFLIIFLVLIILGCETEEIETSELNNATETVEKTENPLDEKTPEEVVATDNEPAQVENEAVEESMSQEETENETEAYVNYHYMRYGNTSRNIANGGYVAYDQDTKKAYY